MRAARTLLCAVLCGCDPGICGSVEIGGVSLPPELARYDRDKDGDIDLAELCGIDDGAYAIDRPDYMFTTVILSPNTPDYDFSADLAVGTHVLPTASFVFRNVHLVPGTTIGIDKLAGSGLHKRDIESIYQVYPLTAGTVTIHQGPRNRKDTSYVEEHWSEEWRISWDLTFGGGIQTWKADDWIKRTDGDTIGRPTYLPPDHMP